MSTASERYPPLLSLRSKTSSFIPSACSFFTAFTNSLCVVAMNFDSLIYPVLSLSIYATSTLYVGMTLRVMVKSIRPSTFLRYTFTSTFVPRGPLRSLIAVEFVTPLPAMRLSPTYTILSPAIIPTFSEGPPFMVFMMVMVSLSIRKVTPIPSKLPWRSSVTSSSTSGLKYSL